MRLLVVTQYFWPENFRVNDLVSEMVKRGHEVTVMTGRPNYPDGVVFKDYLNNPDDFLEYEGASIVRVPMMPRGRGSVRMILNYLTFALSASFLGPVKLRNQNFDAIFVYEPSPITVGIPASVMRAIKKAPMSFWVLDLWPETLQATGVIRSTHVLSLVGKLVTWIYSQCDLILAQSRSFVTQIAQHTDKEKIKYFPSWAESVFDMQECSFAPEVPVVPESFNIMFAGNIGDAQDFPSILNAAEKLKSHQHIRWLIVGDGRQAGWVADEIKRRGLESTVLMLGRYPVERMPEFFKHADALLVSLKDEPIFAMTIPGKLQSYLATGIPILAMLNGEGAEVVQNAKAGLTCSAGDYELLAKAALKLSLLSHEKRKDMGMRGAAISAEEFDRAKLISQLEHWLEMLQLKVDSGRSIKEPN